MICQQASDDENYETLCREAERIENLTFHRRISYHEIGDYFKRAKVLVSTSEAEGFPNVFIQACLHGVPILSLNVNPDDFLIRHSCGICCDGRMERLVEGLRFLLENERYVELGRRGWAYAEQHHDITRIVEQYKDLFRRCACPPG